MKRNWRWSIDCESRIGNRKRFFHFQSHFQWRWWCWWWVDFQFSGGESISWARSGWMSKQVPVLPSPTIKFKSASGLMFLQSFLFTIHDNNSNDSNGSIIIRRRFNILTGLDWLEANLPLTTSSNHDESHPPLCLMLASWWSLVDLFFEWRLFFELATCFVVTSRTLACLPEERK